MYASGATTLGGYFPGVDTFLGLQIAAQEIADDLAKHGFCKRIGPVRSTTQWWKWVSADTPDLRDRRASDAAHPERADPDPDLHARRRRRHLITLLITPILPLDVSSARPTG